MVFTIVFLIHSNFFINFPIQLKICRSNVFSLSQGKMCAPGKSSTAQMFFAPDRTQSAWAAQFVQPWFFTAPLFFRYDYYTWVACPNFWENVAEKSSPKSNVPAGIYLFKINNANIRTVSEIYSKLPVTKPEWRHWSRSGIFIVNFEQISLIVLMFPLLTLNKEMQAGSALNKVFYGQKHRFSEMKILNEF